ncbi:hypothetical protein EOD42_14390 [Rhodovarius crocodyli]|uniref:Uncharacterized protein n=1 Tax=Rhodovarius crocodyli TaxID=1979269 RepID=A0A437MF98_9PROT|nr:hypothetical protein [Rhodovarius crocodyli]RVT96296.1 hypothetical protein EOD42_14390 [Rhodovarius crocodyli]
MARANSPQALVARLSSEAALRALPLAARSLWLSLALAADGDGWLPLPEGAEPREAMAKLAGCLLSEVHAAGKVLWDAEVLHRDEGGRYRVEVFHGISERKLAAQRANAKLGGRPRKDGSPARPALRLVSDRTVAVAHTAETHRYPNGKPTDTQSIPTDTQNVSHGDTHRKATETQNVSHGEAHRGSNARVGISPLKITPNQPPQDSEGESLSAREAPGPEPESAAAMAARGAVLGEKLARIAGFPGTGGYNFREVINWLSQGVSEVTAERVVRELTASKLAFGGDAPGSFSYFRRAVLAAHAAEKALPPGAPKQTGNWDVTPKQRAAIQKAMKVAAAAEYEGWWPKDLDGERDPAVLRRVAKVLQPHLGTEVLPYGFPDMASFERFMARAAAAPAADEGDAA